MGAAFFEGLGDALQIGEQTAKDIVTIANSSDMGDIREDATAEAIARLMQQVPHELYGVALANTVKMLAVALSVYSDQMQGRDPLDPHRKPVAN